MVYCEKEHQFILAQISKVANLEGGPHVYYSSPPFRSPLNDEKHHVDDVYPCDDDVFYYNDDISTMCSTLFIRMVFSLK